MGERLSPDAPHPARRRPPPGTLMPPPQRAKPARKSGRYGVGDESPRRHPPHPQPVGSGPLPHAQTDERSGVGERLSPDTPHPAKRRPPQAPSCRPHSAQSQLARARSWVGDGSPCWHPPHPQPVGSGLRPHARTDEWSGVGERPTLDAPHPGRRRPPRAPSCRPHSAQSQIARARAVGYLTGPHARIPRTHSHRVVGSAARPKGRVVGVGRGPDPGPPTPRQKAPPRAPSCRPNSAQSQLARARAVGLVTGPRARIPRTHSQWVVGPSRTPERTSCRGWESARPRAPRTQARGAPLGRPRAAPTARQASGQGELARARAVGLVTRPPARTHPTGSAQPQAR